jgi:hypothetical protein
MSFRIRNKRMGRDGRVGQGVNQKKIFNRELWCRFESEIREWAEMGEWAKASIENFFFKFKSGRVGSGRVSNLELVDNKRAPNSRVGKGIRIISFIFFIFHRIQQETFKKLHYFLYFLHLLLHSTRNIEKIALLLFFLHSSLQSTIFNWELWCRFESEIREWAEMGEWAKASIKKKKFSIESCDVVSNPK